MRTFLFLAALLAMFVFAVVAGYKPSMVDKEYQRIKEPIEKHFAEKKPMRGVQPRAESGRLGQNKYAYQPIVRIRAAPCASWSAKTSGSYRPTYSSGRGQTRLPMAGSQKVLINEFIGPPLSHKD
jgi:hypothetical protein